MEAGFECMRQGHEKNIPGWISRQEKGEEVFREPAEGSVPRKAGAVPGRQGNGRSEL